MEKEQVKKVIDEGIEKLAAALEQGRSETLVAYLAAVSRFHRYSFGNVMLIISQKPDATRVAGFRPRRRTPRVLASSFRTPLAARACGPKPS